MCEARSLWKVDKERSQGGIKRQLPSYLGSFALNYATGYSVKLITELYAVSNLRDRAMNFVLESNFPSMVV